MLVNNISHMPDLLKMRNTCPGVNRDPNLPYNTQNLGTS